MAPGECLRHGAAAALGPLPAGPAPGRAPAASRTIARGSARAARCWAAPGAGCAAAAAVAAAPRGPTQRGRHWETGRVWGGGGGWAPSECRVPSGSRCQRGRATRGPPACPCPTSPGGCSWKPEGGAQGRGAGQAACGSTAWSRIGLHSVLLLFLLWHSCFCLLASDSSVASAHASRGVTEKAGQAGEEGRRQGLAVGGLGD